MWMFGIAGILGSVILFIKYMGLKKKLALMMDTDTSTVEELKQLREEMTVGLGRGSLTYHTEVKGRVICDQPLTSELAKVPCVYYSMRIDREYEETYIERDQNGRAVRRTRRGFEAVASNIRAVPFYVEDQTGRILVNPDNAEIIPEKILSEYQQERDIRRNYLERDNYRMRLPFNTGSGRNPRTLGYRYEEAVIPLDTRIYVNGEATDRAGQLQLRSPAEESKFIISVKGEEALVQQGKRQMTSYLVFSILTGLVGLGVILLGLGGGL